MQKVDGNKSNEKKSRAKYRCSPELEAIIKAVNLAPRSIKLPNLKAEQDAFEDQIVKVFGLENLSIISVETIGDFYRGVFARLPKELLMFLIPVRLEDQLEEKMADVTYLENMAWQYEDFLKMRQDALNLVDSLTFLNSKEGKNWQGSTLPETRLPRLTMDVAIVKNKISLLPSKLALAVQNIEIDRLRFCKICDKIFWANRKEAEACSPECRNVLHQRRYRNEKKKLINEQRRKTYQSKKEQKQARKVK